MFQNLCSSTISAITDDLINSINVDYVLSLSKKTILSMSSHTHVRLLFMRAVNVSQMLNTGISQLSTTEDLKYVLDALRPEATDAEATTMFTRFIEASLGSRATQINFFFHNLAQRNFSASSSTELSFAPKRYR